MHAVNYPLNYSINLNHAPCSETTAFNALKKALFSLRFPAITLIQLDIRGGLGSFLTKIPLAASELYMRSAAKEQLKKYN
jgi:hypothetical protein